MPKIADRDISCTSQMPPKQLPPRFPWQDRQTSIVVTACLLGSANVSAENQGRAAKALADGASRRHAG